MDYQVTYTVGRCTGTLANGTPVVTYGAPIRNRVSAGNRAQVVKIVARSEGVRPERVRVIDLTRR